MNKPSSVVDIESIELVRRIAHLGSITRVAQETAGSQSALSRRLQEIEARLGFAIFERTTRKLSLTKAGQVLLRETEALSPILEKAMRAVKEECFGEVNSIRVGVSRSLSLAHLPGLFHANRNQEVKINLVHPTGKAVLGNVMRANLDVGVSPLPAKIPQELEVVHRFEDEFVLISNSPVEESLTRKLSFRKWAQGQSWLLPPEGSVSREVLNHWVVARGLEVDATMELDSFDVMVQLVELGMGVAFVPRRALSSFRRGGKLVRLDVGKAPKREVGVFTRKIPKPSQVVDEFVQGILFS